MNKNKLFCCVSISDVPFLFFVDLMNKSGDIFALKCTNSLQQNLLRSFLFSAIFYCSWIYCILLLFFGGFDGTPLLHFGVGPFGTGGLGITPPVGGFSTIGGLTCGGDGLTTFGGGFFILFPGSLITILVAFSFPNGLTIGVFLWTIGFAGVGPPLFCGGGLAFGGGFPSPQPWANAFWKTRKRN